MKERKGVFWRSKLQRILASTLAVCMVATSIPVASAIATSDDTQVESAQETIYVNSYSGNERSIDFNDHWRFYLGDASGAENVIFNDSSWSDVTLPHDYSIDQGFTHAAPAEQESGYVLGGTGWYRKSFILSKDMQGKTISLDFDGIYMNATIWVNGQKLGEHHYGYTPFSFVLPNDILNFGGEENVVAVKVDHQLPSSRWYSGSGIYRNVYMTVTDPVHIAYHGNYVTTPKIADEYASGVGTVHVETTVENDRTEAAKVSIQNTVYRYNEGNSAVEEIAVVTSEPTEGTDIASGESKTIESDVIVDAPALWSTDDPNLYRVRTDVLVAGEVVDSITSDFGFRWFKFTSDGFWLNGEKMRMHGVCLHHDQGSLGSEAWYASMERQIELMKDMGVNAYRTSHNPVSDEMIDICNKKGMLVMEEAYDGWKAYKDGNNHDMGEWFDVQVGEDNQIVYGEPDMTWAEFDLKAMIRRDRNAPSVFSWSIGNEIFQLITGSTSDYTQRAQDLVDWGAEIDNSRVFAYGCNQNTSSASDGVARVLYNHQDDYGNRGLSGYNYSNNFSNGHSKGYNVFSAETASAVNSRGVYDRKTTRQDLNDDKRLTSYDKSAVSWGATASNAMWKMTWAPYLFGEFVWTGIDYLGEPTPWNWTGPGANGQSKNSYFGIVDTAGFPKDTYYLYRSQWNDNENTLHLLPTWDEEDVIKDNQGRVEVVVYSNAPYIELELNGEVVGTATATVRKMEENDVYITYDAGTGAFSKGNDASSQYATFWVPYEEGTLEVKGYDSPEKTEQITEFEGRNQVSTTKGATQLSAYVDSPSIKADGKDLSFVTIDVTDADGHLVNSAEPEITVTVEGDGKLMSLDNGVHDDWTNYSDPTRKAGRGKLLAIVQSTEEGGSFTVTASSRGLQSSSVTVTTEPVAEEEPEAGAISSYVMSRNLYVKVGNMPKLPETATVNYADGKTEEKSIVWDTIPEENIETDGSFSVMGKLDGISVTVNVTMISEAAALLNYSAAVSKGSAPNLPATRPAILADGTILNAEFPVDWETDGIDFSTEGLKKITGTANVFGKPLTVTANVRIAAGEDILTENMTPVAPKSFVNGEPSNGALDPVRDGKKTADSAGWTGTGSIYFEYATAVNFKQAKLYLKDTAPTSDTMRLYRSGDEGATWQPIENGLEVSNAREDGVTIRTYDFDMTPGTAFKLEFDEQVTLLEVELMNSVPDFPVGSEAALDSLQVGGYIASSSALENGLFEVIDTDLNADDVTAQGKDNASVTVLPKNDENIIRILLESEDHAERNVFDVVLGEDGSASDDPDDATSDYPYQDMILTAPSVEKGGSAANANDGDSNTIWHTNWGGGVGPADLTNDPENRYLQIELPTAVKINGMRYLPRNKDQNGIVTSYSIQVSMDGDEWTEVATGDWSTSVEWKLAQFAPVEAKYIRLYGVKTATNEGKPQKYMSAAEVRVRCATTSLYAGNTSIALDAESFDYTSNPITPEPVVVYDNGTESITLTKDVDYTVSYRNNTEPGTATVRVTGKGNYSGIVEKTFTIRPVDVVIEDYEEVEVTTGVGEYPQLPGTVLAYTNIGQTLMEVHWDSISNELLDELGTFKVYGTIAADDNHRIVATVTVSGVVGVESVSSVTTIGKVPNLPEKILVYYSNGDVARRDVEWTLDHVSFDGEVGDIVPVVGMVGTTETLANVRLVEEGSVDNTTEIQKNLALNPDAFNQTQMTDQWPVVRAHASTKGMYVTRVVDGKRGEDHGEIWTSSTSSMRKDFYAITVGFGEGDKTGKLQTISKAVLDFAIPDGSALPEGYKVQYYSGNGGMFDASRFFGTGDIEHVGNTQNWNNTNPINIDDNWTDVVLLDEEYPVPTEENPTVSVQFEPVKTSAIRVVFTPAAGKQVSLYELEFYYMPDIMSDRVTDVSIQCGGTPVTFDDEKTAVVHLESGEGLPEILATAGENASVTVVHATDVNGTARVMITPENGNIAKQEVYTIQFQSEGGASAGAYFVSSQNPNILVKPARTDEGMTVTVEPKPGYTIQEDSLKVLKSADLTDAGVEVAAGQVAGTYTFLMPEFDVTVTGETVKGGEQSLTVTYNSKDVTLKVNGEPQNLADLVGKYVAEDLESGTAVELTFEPRIDGRAFRSVTVDGKEPKLIEGNTYTHLVEMEDHAVQMDFVFELIDKSILRQIYDYATIYVEDGTVDGLISSVKDAFMEAYRTAEDVLNDPAASQNDIDRAWSKLLDALHYLEFKPGDKSGLENLYEILKNLEEDHYTSTGWDAFQEALDRAEEVLADDEALAGDITSAYDDLLNAFEHLEPTADRSALDAALEKAQTVADEIQEGKYLPDGQKDFQDAWRAALDIGRDASQEEVDTATEALVKAMAALRKIPSRDELNAYIQEVEQIDLDGYTDRSVAAFKAALNIAKAAADDMDADGQVLATAFYGLKDAVNGLEKVENPAPGPKPNTNKGNSNRTTIADNTYGTSGVVSAAQAISTQEAYVISDTTVNFVLKHGQAYCFKMKVVNSSVVPNFTVGNGSVLKTQFVAKVGNDYYYRVYAIGTPGQSTGVYTTLPGQNAQKHCTVTIA